MRFQGTNVVITGASRGLGLALAQRLAGEGARVVGVARNAAEIGDAMRRIPGEAHAVAGDVADPAAAVRIAGQAMAALGHVDVVVHNASTLGPVPLRPLVDLTPAQVEAVFQANVLGPVRLTRALVGPMLLRGSGTIVTISSDAAVAAYEGWGAYGASKAALDHVTRTWAAELGGAGIRCFAFDPGEMDTRMHADAVPDADRAALARPEAVAERLVQLLHDATQAPNGARVAA
jgi:NAD(P)-dependent dehydrogenase (short-subunit alcohol dehydrogenase family)